jgi:acetyl-CoA C-acetyltransferase
LRQITDGAVAVVPASDRFVQRYATGGACAPAVSQILGWGHANAGIRFLDKLGAARLGHVPRPQGHHRRLAAGGRGGVDALDGIETRACFTSTEYMAIDHFGLTPPGQSWQAIEQASSRSTANARSTPRAGSSVSDTRSARPGAAVARCRPPGRARPAITNGRTRTYGTLNIGGSLRTVVSLIVGRRDWPLDAAYIYDAVRTIRGERGPRARSLR